MPKIKSDKFSGLTHYQEEHRAKAWKYSVGECSNFIYLKMLNESIKQLLDWDPKEIQSYCRDITSEAIGEMLNMGCDIAPIEERASHLFGVLPPANFDKDKFSEVVNGNKVFVSERGPYYRISPNVYNSEQNLTALKDCFAASIR